MKNTKLVVLRGPSGSGKSAVAKEVRLRMLRAGRLTAYVEQDYFRRIILKEEDAIGGFNACFIKENMSLLLKNGYDVIVEGIFISKKYDKMFRDIIKEHPKNNFFFYFDISLEETIKRHKTKTCKDEFGEKELKSWYKDKDYLGFVEEKNISEKRSLREAVDFIVKSAG